MFSLLIVDDETIVRNAISRRPIWHELGIDYIKTAPGVAQARELIESERPNLVMTDLIMPHEDGFALMRYVQENAPETRVVVLSAYNEFAYAAEAMRLGARGYVLKPTDDEQIRSIFGGLVEELRRERLWAKEVSAYRSLNPVLDYIGRNYSERISLEMAAELAGMSPAYFSATFSRVCGVTFVDYVNSVRVEKAKALLRTTSDRIQEIGERVGFRDNTYFCRVFRKFTGMSPASWRRQV